MDTNLTFCDIDVIPPHIGIISIHEGENITLQHALAISNTLCSQLTTPSALIIDRTYHFSYDLDALFHLYNKSLFDKVIVVCYRSLTEKMFDLEKNLCREDLLITHSLIEAINLCKTS